MNALAVGAGAMLGAWLRWGVGVWLATAHPKLQMGTLLVNLAGGYLVGLALAAFAANPQLAPAWRLFAITGFLGGLTTFSAFSGEVLLLLQRGDYGWALAQALLHLAGSIICSIAGFATWRAVTA